MQLFATMSHDHQIPSIQVSSNMKGYKTPIITVLYRIFCNLSLCNLQLSFHNNMAIKSASRARNKGALPSRAQGVRQRLRSTEASAKACCSSVSTSKCKKFWAFSEKKVRKVRNKGNAMISDEISSKYYSYVDVSLQKNMGISCLKQKG